MEGAVTRGLAAFLLGAGQSVVLPLCEASCGLVWDTSCAASDMPRPALG